MTCECQKFRAAIWSDDSTAAEQGQQTAQDAARFVSGLRGEIARLSAAINPVRHWYDGDGEYTDVVEMLNLAIADLQDDRKELISLARDRDKLKDEIEKLRQRYGDLLTRARGTRRCQICGASYTKGQDHDQDCPVGLVEQESGK